MECASSFQYLGLLPTEFLHIHVYELMTKTVATSASRALGKLIVKSEADRGFQHNILLKLYVTTVWSVISYGASIWGN